MRVRRKSVLVTCGLGLQVLVSQFAEDGLCCQHAALHSRVGSFDLRHVHEARAAADEGAARKHQLGHGLQRTRMTQ